MGEEAVYGVLFPLSSPISTLSILYNLTLGETLCGIFFRTGEGLLIKKVREKFFHSFALILLVDLIHGNFLIGPKICLHLLVFERHITLTSLTSAIFLPSLGSGLAVTTFVFDKQRLDIESKVRKMTPRHENQRR